MIVALTLQYHDYQPTMRVIDTDLIDTTIPFNAEVKRRILESTPNEHFMDRSHHVTFNREELDSYQDAVHGLTLKRAPLSSPPAMESVTSMLASSMATSNGATPSGP